MADERNLDDLNNIDESGDDYFERLIAQHSGTFSALADSDSSQAETFGEPAPPFTDFSDLISSLSPDMVSALMDSSGDQPETSDAPVDDFSHLFEAMASDSGSASADASGEQPEASDAPVDDFSHLFEAMASDSGSAPAGASGEQPETSEVPVDDFSHLFEAMASDSGSAPADASGEQPETSDAPVDDFSHLFEAMASDSGSAPAGASGEQPETSGAPVDDFSHLFEAMASDSGSAPAGASGEQPETSGAPVDDFSHLFEAMASDSGSAPADASGEQPETSEVPVDDFSHLFEAMASDSGSAPADASGEQPETSDAPVDDFSHLFEAMASDSGSAPADAPGEQPETSDAPVDDFFNSLTAPASDSAAQSENPFADFGIPAPKSKVPTDGSPFDLSIADDLFREAETGIRQQPAEASGADPDDIDPEAMFKLENSFAKLDQMVLQGGKGEYDPDSIDAQLARALELEQAASGFDMSAQLEDFIHEETVYTEDSGKPAAKAEENEPSKFGLLIDSIPPKLLMAIMGAILLIIVLMVVLMTVMYLRVRHQAQPQVEIGAAVKQTGTVVNDANYITVNKSVEFESGTLTLVKMQMDTVATVLHFSDFVDVSKYDLTLQDGNNLLYNLDMSYLNDPMTHDKNMASVLHFEPLPSSTAEFTLVIQNIETGEKTPLNFAFENAVQIGRPHYLLTPAVLDMGGGTSVTITAASFTSTGTTVNYELSWEGNDNVLLLSGQDQPDNFTLSEGTRQLYPTKTNPNRYVFAGDNKILGRMDFSAVRNIDGKIDINFENVYLKAAVNRDIPLSRILYSNNNPPEILEVDGYNIFLERAGAQGSRYILVLHAEYAGSEAGLGTDSIDNRVQTLLDVELVVRADGAETIIAPQLTRNAQRGSDIVFDVSGHRSLFTDQSPDNILFRVNSAYIMQDDVSVTVDLLTAESSLPENTLAALEAVDTAFRQRIGYRSGRLEPSGLTMFSDSLVSNEALMAEYSPRAVTEPQYSVQVVTYSLLDNRLIAAVQEIWRGKENGVEKRFSRLHKIVCENSDRGWVVAQDEIVN